MLTLKRIRHSFQRFRFYLSLEAAIVGLVSYSLGARFGSMIHQSSVQIGGLWCLISALVVLQSLFQQARQIGLIRITGSFIGALISGVVCQIWGYGYWQLLVVIFISIYLMDLLSEEKAARLSSATAGVIVVIGMMHPNEAAWFNALARFVESLMGVSVAMIILLLAERLGLRNQPERKKHH